MDRHLTCIECPKGCSLTIQVENGKVVGVTGNQCEKGHTYALGEVENPVRLFTSTVLAIGLDLKMVPVRTDQPIPRDKILLAVEEVKKVRIKKSVRIGDIIVENFLETGSNLVATRQAFACEK